MALKKSVKSKAAGEATTFVEKAGAKHMEAEPVQSELTSDEAAKINVSMGARIGLPDYSDVRFGCSITVPCDADEEAMEQAFQFCESWCKEKMEKLHDTVLGDKESESA